MKNASGIIKAALVNRGYVLDSATSSYVKKRYTGAMTTIEVTEGIRSTGIAKNIYNTRGYLVLRQESNTADVNITELLASLS